MNLGHVQPEGCVPVLEERINSFALVAYFPDPLAAFLDRLRRELVPSCFLHAHVTVLPPRPLQAPAEKAWDRVRRAAPGFTPFDLELTEVKVLPVTDVICISLGRGQDELKWMHDALNAGDLGYREPFPYHPHVTVAQQLSPDQLDEFREVAARRWAEYPHHRGFRVERVTFVQNTHRNVWIDLGECELGTTKAEVLEPLLV